MQDHLHKPDVISRGRVESTTAVEGCRCWRKNSNFLLERSVGLALMAVDQAVKFRGGYEKRRVFHAERLADIPLKILLERQSAHLLHKLSGPIGAVAVLPALTRIEHQRYERRDSNRGCTAV